MNRDLQAAAWIRNPRLYVAAREEAAKDVPAGTRLFWKRTLDTYQKLGGRLEADQGKEADR